VWLLHTTLLLLASDHGVVIHALGTTMNIAGHRRRRVSIGELFHVEQLLDVELAVVGVLPPNSTRGCCTPRSSLPPTIVAEFTPSGGPGHRRVSIGEEGGGVLHLHLLVDVEQLIEVELAAIL
jgi:hypothetical protein